MRTIWKYKIVVSAKSQTMRMPRGARLLHVETHGDTPCLWALVDPSAEQEDRVFATVGTGWEFDPSQGIETRKVGGPVDLGRVGGYQYVGTFLLSGGALVFHLFEVR